MNEIEVKLTLHAGDVAAFRRAAPLAGARARRRKLASLYFDTPQRELQRAGYALRVRKQQRRWVQTLKGGGGAIGGLHVRGEWESARPDATVDVTALPAEALEGVSQAATLGSRLANLFHVEVQRETWEVEPVAGTRIEVALDRGEVRAGERSEPICEVELELVCGERGPAFDLAHALVDAVPLRPSAVTKAQRGYRLSSGEVAQATKAVGVELEAGMAVERAARLVVAAALEQLQANEEGVLASADPEFVHQARVGLRRLRSALRLFRAVAPAAAAQWRSGLADVARALGEARDWDVFATESLPPLVRAFGEARASAGIARRAQARRRGARERARSALRAPAHAHIVLDLARWLAADDAIPAPAVAAPEGDGVPQAPAATVIGDFALRVVRKRHKRLLEDARGLATLSPEERHKVRIDAKRLRYAVDGFTALFKAKRVRRYLAALSDLQDLLGAANDAVTATRLITELEPPAELAAFARGWLAARAVSPPEHVAKLLQRLEDERPFPRQRKREED